VAVLIGIETSVDIPYLIQNKEVTSARKYFTNLARAQLICGRPIITYNSQGRVKTGTETKDDEMIYNGNTSARPTSDNRPTPEIGRGRKSSDKLPGLDFQEETRKRIIVLGMTGAGISNFRSSLCSQKDSDDLYNIPSPMLVDTPGIAHQIGRNEGIGHKECSQDLLKADKKHEKWKICHTCGVQKYGYDIDRAQYHKHGHFRLSPKALAVLGLSSGLAMAVSFLWLSASMGLNETSPAMVWVGLQFQTHRTTKANNKRSRKNPYSSFLQKSSKL
jgi:hypothetical protein